MFDFDDLETTDPAESESVEDVALAASAAVALRSEAFTERRDACRVLAQLKEAARPHLAQLLHISESDEDYEVQKAAKNALRSLRRQGISPEVSDPVPVIAEKQSLQSRREVKEEVPNDIDVADWLGPKALFDINGQILEMSLENQVTPNDLVQIWESWRLHYTQRIRFVVKDGEEVRVASVAWSSVCS